MTMPPEHQPSPLDVGGSVEECSAVADITVSPKSDTPAQSPAGPRVNPLALQVAIEVLTVADDEARRDGLAGGLADSLDNDGKPYQSSALANALAIVRRASGYDLKALQQLPPPAERGDTGRQESDANTSADGQLRDDPSPPSPDLLGEVEKALEEAGQALTQAGDWLLERGDEGRAQWCWERLETLTKIKESRRG